MKVVRSHPVALVMCCALFLPVLIPNAVAELLVDFVTNSAYVTVNQNGQGYSSGAVPWSLASPRSPIANYSGPTYYGGATGSTAISAGTFLFANSTPDYINVQAATGTAGDWVTLVPMFILPQASSLTSLTLRARGSGSPSVQTNYTRIIIQQGGGTLYVSETNWYHIGLAPQQSFNRTALEGLTWFAYDPVNQLTGQSAVSIPGVTLTNVTAVGVLLYNENVGGTARASTIGLSEFLAWGVEGGTVTTNFPVGEYTFQVVNAHGFSVPEVGIYTNAGGSYLTNAVTQPGPANGTQLVALGWIMTGNEPASGATMSFTMTATNDAVLTWLWQTNVAFTRTAGTGGRIAGDVSGYFPLGSSMVVTGIPFGGYTFSGWSGDVPPGQTNDNPLLLTLDGARTVFANFITNGEPWGPLQLSSLSNAPAAARFVLPPDRVWPATPGEPDVCLWDGDRFAALSITIDDNHAEDFGWWAERSAETGFKFTWFVISGRVGKDGSTWPGFQALQNAGHSIQSHTESHLIDIINGWPGIDWDYQSAQTNILANVSGTRVLALSYPGGYQNVTLPYSTNNDRVAAAKYYYAVRGTVGTPNKANMIDYFNIASVGVGTGRAYTDSILYGTSSIAWLNNSQFLRGWQCTHFHNVTNLPAQAPVWAADMAYLATVTNDLWVGLFDEVVRYGQERDTSVLSVLTNDERAMRFTLSDDMMDERFDFPLTVKIRLYESWTNPVALQSGVPVPLSEVLTNGARFALVRVIPDHGDVVLLDRSTDDDQDSVPDWEEIRAGSDPDNPDDYPRLLSSGSGANGNVVFWWNSAESLRYNICVSTNLLNGFGMRLLTNVSATPPMNTVTVLVPDATAYYLLQAD